MWKYWVSIVWYGLISWRIVLQCVYYHDHQLVLIFFIFIFAFPVFIGSPFTCFDASNYGKLCNHNKAFSHLH